MCQYSFALLCVRSLPVVRRLGILVDHVVVLTGKIIFESIGGRVERVWILGYFERVSCGRHVRVCRNWDLCTVIYLPLTARGQTNPFAACTVITLHG